MGIGDWGLGIGGWRFGVGGLGPTPTPQIPNPKSPIPIKTQKFYNIKLIKISNKLKQ